MTQAYPRWFSRSLYVLIALAILIRLFYWHYTDRTWEDALITVLHSENAASGLGLTHLQPPGEPPLHGFTSPLSVLIPLLGDLVHVGWGVLFLKLVSAFCGGIAVWLGARLARLLDLPSAIALTIAAWLAFEHHQILWGMAGMETQVVTVAYLWSILVFLRVPHSPANQWLKGITLGVTMLARPDAALWVAIAFIWEGWELRKTHTWRRILPIIYGLAVVYGPWLIFTTAYYGSPVPNTVHAKGLGYPSSWLQFHRVPLMQKPAWLLGRLYNAGATLGPAYGGNGTGFVPLWDHRVISFIMIALAVVGVIVAIRRRDRVAILPASFATVYLAYLVLVVPGIFGWYTAPVVAVTIFVSFYGLWALAGRIADIKIRQRTVAIAGIAYVIAIVSILPWTFPSDKYLQMYVDGGIRKQAGLFIHNDSKPGDTVGAEPLGYIGYYSRRVVYDYPGLCSRDVVNLLKAHPEDRSLVGMVMAMRPTYLVLRPNEYGDQAIRGWLAQNYDLVLDLNVPEEDRRKILHPEVDQDFQFHVYRLKARSSSSPQPATANTATGHSAS